MSVASLHRESTDSLIAPSGTELYYLCPHVGSPHVGSMFHTHPLCTSVGTYTALLKGYVVKNVLHLATKHGFLFNLESVSIYSEFYAPSPIQPTPSSRHTTSGMPCAELTRSTRQTLPWCKSLSGEYTSLLCLKTRRASNRERLIALLYSTLLIRTMTSIEGKKNEKILKFISDQSKMSTRAVPIP